MGTELAGKTLAVIGCGRIGQQVCTEGETAAAFDRSVYCLD